MCEQRWLRVPTAADHISVSRDAASCFCAPSATPAHRSACGNSCSRRPASTRSGRNKPHRRKDGPPEEFQMAGDQLLSVVEAATYLGIRPWTLRHWISNRKIEIVKYGNGIARIRRSVLDRYVSSCTIKARASHGRSTKESRLLEGADVGSREESLAR